MGKRLSYPASSFCNRGEAKISALGAPDTPGVAAAIILGPAADATSRSRCDASRNTIQQRRQEPTLSSPWSQGDYQRAMAAAA